MKFGPMAVRAAEGMILAHSVALGQGRLRKGTFLTQAHIEQLRAAGVDEVIAAQLEADDVHEDAAAAQLARGLLGRDAAAFVAMNAPFTGRVNLVARQEGLARLDVARLIEVNRIDPALTVATVPPYQQMQKGGLLATIKIISFSVPGAALCQAEEIGAAAIDFAPPRISEADLIITQIGGGTKDAKARDITAQRLRALGCRLAQTHYTGHDISALAEVIAQSTAPLILILTGSATSDLNDVAPQALRLAGGRVRRFGIPVDPGNLLFLGDIKNRPVIGLPGCARSPALNGADWVLSRIICDCPISDDDFAAFGIGGLLKEIPTRPQPRRGK